MYGLFLTNKENGTITLLSDHYNVSLARKAFEYQLNLLAKHEKSNEYQPTSNQKDIFHFYIKNEDTNKEEKRGCFVHRIYKNKKMSFILRSELIETAKNNHLINGDDLAYIKGLPYSE